MAGNETNAVQAVDTAFGVLEGLKELGGAGVSELARHLDAPKSTVHNHLTTLEDREYVVREGNTYRIGLRFLGLGEVARRRREIYDVAKPEVEKLAERTGEISAVMIEEHGRGVFLYRSLSEQAVHIDSYTGQRIDLHATALGKAILAFLPDGRVSDVIEEHGLPRKTANTVTSRTALFDELAEIRETRIAFDDEERLEGLRCVASPIGRNDGTPVGAISVAGPTNRLKDGRFRDDLPELVLSAANVIELNMAYA